MKLSSMMIQLALLGSLLFMKTSTANSLRGGEDEAGDIGDEERALTSGWPWDYYPGACRVDKGGKDHGRRNHDYYLYKGSHVDEQWCYHECQRNDYCLAFEWTGKWKQCEVWKTKPQGYFNNGHGAKCYHKPQARVPSVQVQYYYYDGACRADHHANDPGKNGVHYHLYHGYSYNKCRSECSKFGWCHGFEYKYSKKRCELWKKPTKSVKALHGFKCAKKKFY